MAIAYQAQSTGSVFFSTSLTFSHTPSGTDRVLIVSVTSLDTSATITATFNGVSMTQIATLDNNGVYRQTAFYLVNPSATTANVVVTSTVTDIIRACAVTYSGAQQDSSVIDGSNSGFNDGVILNTTITTSNSGTWGISCVGGEETPPVPDSQTSRSVSSDEGARIADTNGAMSVGSNTATLPSNGGFAAHSNIFFGIKESAGSSPVTNPSFLLNFI